MQTVAAILIHRNLYSLELELELLRLFELVRSEFDADLLEHAQRRAVRVSECYQQQMRPTVAVILQCHCVYSAELRDELDGFFTARLPLYNRLAMLEPVVNHSFLARAGKPVYSALEPVAC